MKKTEVFNTKNLVWAAAITTAMLLACLLALVSVRPANAAIRTVFSSPGNIGIMACKSSSTSYRFGVQNYTSLPIYEVRFVNASGAGNYLNYIPGYYGAKWSPYAQKIVRQETRYVKIKSSASSAPRSLGSFYFNPYTLPTC